MQKETKNKITYLIKLTKINITLNKNYFRKYLIFNI